MRIRLARSVALPLIFVVVDACIPAGLGRPGSSAAVESNAVPSLAIVASPTSAAGPSVPPTFLRPTPTPLPTFLAYVVKRGDTLTSIARAHRTTARSIAYWNRSQHPSLDPDSPSYAPDRIEIGWILLLVPGMELDPEDLPPASPSAAQPARVRPQRGPAGTGRRTAST